MYVNAFWWNPLGIAEGKIALFLIVLSVNLIFKNAMYNSSSVTSESNAVRRCESKDSMIVL